MDLSLRNHFSEVEYELNKLSYVIPVYCVLLDCWTFTVQCTVLVTLSLNCMSYTAEL